METVIPATLGREDAIPAVEMSAAEELFASFADADDRSTVWRRENYLIWRTGWNRVTRRYQANCVIEHAEAMALVRRLCACLHEWKVVGRYDSTNEYLGTYERGDRRECSKCGERDVKITRRNNWSGD